MMPFHTGSCRPEAPNAGLSPMRVVVTATGSTCRIVPPLEASNPRPRRLRWSRSLAAQPVPGLADSPSGWPCDRQAGLASARAEKPGLETGRPRVRQGLELLVPILLLLAITKIFAMSGAPTPGPQESGLRASGLEESGPREAGPQESGPQESWQRGSETLKARSAMAGSRSLDRFALETAQLPADRARAFSAAEPSANPTALLSSDPGQASRAGSRMDSRLAASDTLWLARAIFSESKRRHEQELVAWVIRNRVETGYQGRTTYRDVVLAPYQFSAFNPGNPKRAWLTALNADSDEPGWPQALEIARRVHRAPASTRPFPISTRHFYSEQSLLEDPPPAWAVAHRLARPTPPEVDAARFLFYDGVL